MGERQTKCSSFMIFLGFARLPGHRQFPNTWPVIQRCASSSHAIAAVTSLGSPICPDPRKLGIVDDLNKPDQSDEHQRRNRIRQEHQPWAVAGHGFSLQMDQFRAVAKETQAKYGTSNSAARLDSRLKA